MRPVGASPPAATPGPTRPAAAAAAGEAPARTVAPPAALSTHASRHATQYRASAPSPSSARRRPPPPPPSAPPLVAGARRPPGSTARGPSCRNRRTQTARPQAAWPPARNSSRPRRTRSEHHQSAVASACARRTRRISSGTSMKGVWLPSQVQGSRPPPRGAMSPRGQIDGLGAVGPVVEAEVEGGREDDDERPRRLQHLVDRDVRPLEDVRREECRLVPNKGVAGAAVLREDVGGEGAGALGVRGRHEVPAFGRAPVEDDAPWSSQSSVWSAKKEPLAVEHRSVQPGIARGAPSARRAPA